MVVMDVAGIGARLGSEEMRKGPFQDIPVYGKGP
jgi:hypothetical protein